MKRLLSYLFFISLSIFATYAQKDKQAKEILDKAATTFKKSGGIEAKFTIYTFLNGKSSGKSQGTIQVKGDKFVIQTPEGTSWFDGTTQWSYVASTDEVNISVPTQEELQGINPYLLLEIYKKGFDYRFNGLKTMNGKQGYEIILTSEDKKEELKSITLFVAKTYQPIYIELQQKDKRKSNIHINNYLTGQSYEDSFFRFDKNKYPNAEIIDLR